MTANTRTS